MKVDAKTLLCATIANPNRATKSPIMHNAGFEALGINYVYMAFEPVDLAGALNAMRALDIKGFSVSKPYKEEVLKYVDEIDEIAQKIGAINTVHNVNGKLKGYNSDWIGAVAALQEITKVEGKKVYIVGAGGAGRAIAYGLKTKGAEVLMFNRSKERAQKVADNLGVGYGGGLEDLLHHKEYDILVNATSVGFYPNIKETVIPKNVLIKGKTVLDVVFNPLETQLIKDARKAGCKVALGIRMLVLQGAFQFKLFTGEKPPIEIMQKALEKALLQ